MDPKLDFFLNGQAHGGVANRLSACGMSVNALRTWVGADGCSYMTAKAPDGTAEAVLTANASTLRKDEWKRYDTAVVQVARDRLVGVADLRSRGLVFSLGGNMGFTVLEYEDISDMEAAQLSMSGITRGDRDRVEYTIKYLPLPIIHKDFGVNARVLAASRMTGRPLDTTMAEVAARKVAEKLETILFQGSSTYTFGGGTIYGYQDFPSRNTVSLAVNWDASAATGTLIVDDVRAMKQASIDAKHFGPFVLYVPTNYDTVLDDDHKAESTKTIRKRILEIDGIQDVKVADYLSDDNVVLVEMSAQTVRMVDAVPINTVQWDTEGGMRHNFKVLTISVPQLRADQAGNSGITHLA